MAKLAAVVSSRGLGDGVMMMVASHFLKNQGYSVTTFHNSLGELKHWFPGHQFAKMPSVELCYAVFSCFDLIILQYDHHRLETKILIELYKQGKIPNLSIFFPSKNSSAREKLTTWDQVFDEEISMVDNIATSMASLFKIHETSKNNGLTPPFYLSRARFSKRILIHPTRSNEDYVWPAKKFLKVARELADCGYDIHFILSPKEQSQWPHLQREGFSCPKFNHLGELAAFIFESAVLVGNDSGPAHLASNLQLPTVVISNCPHRMKLWRPSWRKGVILTPSPWVINIKGLKLREKFWDSFITPKQVASKVINICKGDF